MEVFVHHSLKFIVQANMHESLGHQSDVTKNTKLIDPM